MVDIIIVTYNARAKILRCLRSIREHTRSVPYTLTIIDNHSTDGTRESLRKQRNSIDSLLLLPKNLGFSGAANKALFAGRNPWVALLDDDIEVTPQWLEKLLQCAQLNPQIGIVGGKVVWPNGLIFSAEFKFEPFGMVGKYERDQGQRDYIRECDALPGPCWLMRRDAIKKIGPFDERYFPCQYEDIDYCVRARLAGYQIIYNGRIRVVHHHLYRFGDADYLLKNRVRFFKKWKHQLSSMTLVANSDDRLLKKGAKLLSSEPFCPKIEGIGAVSRLNQFYPPSLYRAIALLDRGQRNRSRSELKHAARLVKNNTQISNRERATVNRLLSIYFHKLGLERHAKQLADNALEYLTPKTMCSPHRSWLR